MTVSDLMDELGRLPPLAPVRIYLRPDLFPDGVDLNELPGEYKVGRIERAPTQAGYGVLIETE